MCIKTLSPVLLWFRQVLCAVAKGIKGGAYYQDCNLAPSSAHAHDATMGRGLWQLSERLCGLPEWPPAAVDGALASKDVGLTMAKNL